MDNKKVVLRVFAIIFGIIGLASFIFLTSLFVENIDNLFFTEGDEEALERAFASVLLLLPLQFIVSAGPAISGIIVIGVSVADLKRQEKKEAFTIVMLVLGIIFLVGAIVMDGSLFVIAKLKS